MSQIEKLIRKILTGSSDQSVTFKELCAVALHFGFEERVKGSHHIFSKAGIAEIVNLQPKHDGHAKPYQVKQVREMLIKYRMVEDDK